MSQDTQLHLYEEISLLALRDRKGTFSTERIEYLISGAVLAELLLNDHISVGETKKLLVEIKDGTPNNDPILGECHAEMHASKRQRSLKDWVSRISRIRDLRHKVAKQLCQRQILRADEKTTFLIFAKKVYPEVNPVPEKQILERLRAAIFSDDDEIDPRTAIIITLADGCDLLNEPFGRKELKKRKARIRNISSGQLVGQVTKEVIAACQAAEMVAVIIPTIVVTSLD